MHKPRALALALVTVLAGALLSAPAATTADAAAPAAEKKARQTFVILDTNAEDPDATVVGLGAIHATGTDVVVSAKKDRFEFPDGNVIIRHKVAKGSIRESFDPDTCYYTFSERGTWKAVDGSDAYEDVEGGGNYTAIGWAIGCNENEPPELFSLRVVAKGSVTY